MKNDERLDAIKKDANAKAFGLSYMGLWAIIAYRQFILQQSPKEYNDIFLLVIGLSLFLVSQIVLKGGYQEEKSKTKGLVTKIFFNLIMLTAFLVLFVLLTGLKAPLDLALAGLTFLVISKAHHLFSYLSDKIIQRDLDE